VVAFIEDRVFHLFRSKNLEEANKMFDLVVEFLEGGEVELPSSEKKILEEKFNLKDCIIII
jgi:hypothetical protein